MNIRFLTLAETEVDNAVSWYQKQTEDQSLNFLNELDHALEVVKAYLLATEIEPDIRRFLLRRFPCSLIYGIEEDTIVVIALAHDHRKPTILVRSLRRSVMFIYEEEVECCTPLGARCSRITLVTNNRGYAGRRFKIRSSDYEKGNIAPLTGAQPSRVRRL